MLIPHTPLTPPLLPPQKGARGPESSSDEEKEPGDGGKAPAQPNVPPAKVCVRACVVVCVCAAVQRGGGDLGIRRGQPM